MDVADNIVKKYKDVIVKSDLGLIGVSENKTKTYIRAKKNDVMKPYIRLMNLVISNEAYVKEAAI